MASIVLGENLAARPGVRRQIKEQWNPLQKLTRDDRRTYRETWLRYYRIWSATRDQEAYEGRLQTYFPIGRKHMEAWVKRLKRDLFPQDEWFTIRALREVFEKRVAGLTALYNYFYQKHTRIRRNSTPFLRQLVTYGTSPVLTVWRLDEREEMILRDLFDEEGRLTGKWETVEQKLVDFIGPTFQPIDLFSWYGWPVTCTNVQDCELVFRDLLVSKAKVRELAKTPLHPADPDLGMTYDPDGVQELIARGSAWQSVRDKLDAEVRRLQDKGFTHPIDQRFPIELQPLDITEGTWCTRFEDDDGKERVYRVVMGADDIPLLVQRAPWWYGQHSYLVGKLVEVQNELYGRGLPEVFDKLQYFINDIGNQAGDALVWSTNPIALIDMFEVQDPDSIRMRPGAKWLVPPNSVEFSEPPQNVAMQGFNAMGQSMALMAELAAPAPAAAPPTRSRGRTQQSQQQTQLMISELQVDIREITELNEDLVYNPFLRRTHILIQQCLDREILLKVTGDDGVTLVESQISVADTIGDYEFAWLGSVATQNQQVRGAQMINALGIYTKIPPQMLEKQGYEIDFAYIARQVWSVGLGLPGGERVVKLIKKHRMVDWRIENELFRVGRGDEVKVNEGDPDDEHGYGHGLLLNEKDLPDETRKLVTDHIRAHVAAKLAKDQLKQQQQMMQMLQSMMPPGGAPGGNGKGAGPAAGGAMRMKPPAGPGRMRNTLEIGDVYRSMPRGVM